MLGPGWRYDDAMRLALLSQPSVPGSGIRSRAYVASEYP
jgi:hypothetical protein